MTNETLRLRVMLVIVCLLAGTVFFWQLGTRPLENWDEGIHASVTLEMVERHAWIDLSYRGAQYTAKPPLKFWLTAPLFVLFGASEFAARFWSALAGVGTAFLLSLWIWQWKRKAWAAVLAAMLFLTLRANFFHGFRTGETDGLMVFFTVLALWAYWNSWMQKRSWWVTGVAVGLAFMTKPLGGVLPLIIIGLDILAGWRWRKLPWKHMGLAALCAAVVALPWHIVESIRHGSAFWDSFVGFHVIDRANEVLYKNYVPWWWYWTIVKLRAFPYVPFIVLATLLGGWRWIRQRDALDRLLVIWVAAVAIMFTLVQTKFDWYILPLYPATVLLLVRLFSKLLERNQAVLRILFLLAFGWAIYLLPAGLKESGNLWKLTPYVYFPTISLVDWVQRLFVSIVCVAAVLLLFFACRRYAPHRATVFTGSLALAFFIILAAAWQLSYFRHLPDQASLKSIADFAAQHSLRRLDAVDADLVHQPALYFYLNRIPGLQLNELRAGSQPTSPYVLTRETSLMSLPEPCCAILTAGAYMLLEQPTR